MMPDTQVLATAEPRADSEEHVVDLHALTALLGNKLDSILMSAHAETSPDATCLSECFPSAWPE